MKSKVFLVILAILLLVFTACKPKPSTPTVATPSISVLEVMDKDKEVSITCTTSGAMIYYTVLGEDPTSESTDYSRPFVVSSTVTVKAIAFKDGVKSEIAKQTVEVSKCAAPEVTVFEGVHFIEETSLNVELYTTTEGATIHYKTSIAGDYAVYTPGTEITIENGDLIMAYTTKVNYEDSEEKLYYYIISDESPIFAGSPGRVNNKIAGGYWNKDGEAKSLKVDGLSGHNSVYGVAKFETTPVFCGKGKVTDVDRALAWIGSDQAPEVLPIPEGGTSSQATAIEIKGSVAYVTGYYYDSNSLTHACYWTRDLSQNTGVWSDAQILTSTGSSRATSVAVVGDVVYFGGICANCTIPCVWTDGGNSIVLSSDLSQINAIGGAGDYLFAAGKGFCYRIDLTGGPGNQLTTLEKCNSITSLVVVPEVGGTGVYAICGGQVTGSDMAATWSVVDGSTSEGPLLLAANGASKGKILDMDYKDDILLAVGYVVEDGAIYSGYWASGFFNLLPTDRNTGSYANAVTF